MIIIKLKMSTSTGIKKLENEYKAIRKKNIFGAIQASAAPIEKDFLHWSGCLEGPMNTPYSGGTYYFEIKFPNEYPKKGPIDVQMRTKIYHPNINNTNGHICDSYFSEWKETYNVAGIVHAIFDLLDEPNDGDGYRLINVKKAEELNSKYATIDQEINWKESWNKGFDID